VFSSILKSSAMFEKFKNKSFDATQERFDTLVGRTTTLFGRLVLLDSVRIDGKVVGNIETAPDNKISVAIGLTGEVNGDITAYRVLVAGKVNGNIYAAERVEFHKDAVVNGDISYGSIAVEHGARLLGMVVQNKASTQSANRAQEAIQNAQSKP
jgi:cytoskeletal protein CcmA (bactofilin family)